jgi:hypothetical protein
MVSGGRLAAVSLANQSELDRTRIQIKLIKKERVGCTIPMSLLLDRRSGEVLHVEREPLAPPATAAAGTWRSFR